MKPTPLVLLVVFLAIGAYLLWRALQGGGPVYYFLSAVAFGMAIGVMQGINRGRRG
ncbi:MAG TPA: hypothetical protein VFN07_04015 [Trueperaceae bacterium]|nr:hypothetical protein [Trueperaceae bacterium]